MKHRKKRSFLVSISQTVHFLYVLCIEKTQTFRYRKRQEEAFINERREVLSEIMKNRSSNPFDLLGGLVEGFMAPSKDPEKFNKFSVSDTIDEKFLADVNWATLLMLLIGILVFLTAYIQVWIEMLGKLLNGYNVNMKWYGEKLGKFYDELGKKSFAVSKTQK